MLEKNLLIHSISLLPLAVAVGSGSSLNLLFSVARLEFVLAKRSSVDCLLCLVRCNNVRFKGLCFVSNNPNLMVGFHLCR